MMFCAHPREKGVVAFRRAELLAVFEGYLHRKGHPCAVELPNIFMIHQKYIFGRKLRASVRRRSFFFFQFELKSAQHRACILEKRDTDATRYGPGRSIRVRKMPGAYSRDTGTLLWNVANGIPNAWSHGPVPRRRQEGCTPRATCDGSSTGTVSDSHGIIHSARTRRSKQKSS